MCDGERKLLEFRLYIISGSMTLHFHFPPYVGLNDIYICSIFTVTRFFRLEPTLMFIVKWQKHLSYQYFFLVANESSIIV